MKKKNQKNVNEEIIKDIAEELTDEVINIRQNESEEMLSILENFPGSRCEELMIVSGYCGNCFSRRMAWLKVNKLVEFDGNYWWLVNGIQDLISKKVLEG
ncbi:MAG: hypothetical protein Q7U36_04305 [bacterium]|nr:hypothetical protein [bacterium]